MFPGCVVNFGKRDWLVVDEVSESTYKILSLGCALPVCHYDLFARTEQTQGSGR